MPLTTPGIRRHKKEGDEKKGRYHDPIAECVEGNPGLKGGAGKMKREKGEENEAVQKERTRGIRSGELSKLWSAVVEGSREGTKRGGKQVIEEELPKQEAVIARKRAPYALTTEEQRRKSQKIAQEDDVGVIRTGVGGQETLEARRCSKNAELVRIADQASKAGYHAGNGKPGGGTWKSREGGCSHKKEQQRSAEKTRGRQGEHAGT